MHHRIKVKAAENCIAIRGNFSNTKVEDHILENLWMPIKKRYVSEHQLAIAMCIVHTEGLTTLNFYTDMRNCRDYEPLLATAINELAQLMDEHFTNNEVAFIEETAPPSQLATATA